jgi:outer membrane immunogenic protein
MRKCVYLLFAVMVLGLAVPVMAQDDTPKVEAFAGYSFVHASVNPGGGVSYGYNFNGGSGQLAYNLTHMFGIVGDFGGYTTDTVSHGVPLDTNVISYMVGPRVSFRSSGSRIVPYAQALLGGARLANGYISGNAVNNFALALGGGIDFKLTQHIWVRPVQAEYFMTTFNDGNNDRQNNFRYSAGVVLAF